MLDIKLDENQISNFSNPFDKTKVYAVRLYWYNSSANWGGAVEFKNGDTQGQQNFHAPTMPEIAKQMDDFMKHLK